MSDHNRDTNIRRAIQQGEARARADALTGVERITISQAAREDGYQRFGFSNDAAIAAHVHAALERAVDAKLAGAK